jgi:hypothetical protein
VGYRCVDNIGDHMHRSVKSRGEEERIGWEVGDEGQQAKSLCIAAHRQRSYSRYTALHYTTLHYTAL